MKDTIFADNYSFLLGNSYDSKNQVILFDFICWEERNFFVKLIEKFINEQIDGDDFQTEFATKFFKLYGSTPKKRVYMRFYTSKVWLEKLETVPLEQVKAFSRIISDLYADCWLFADPIFRYTFGISEEELRDEAEAAYFKLKDRYP